jgi:MFS family permease
LVRDSPESIGLTPDGAPAVPGRDATSAARRTSVGTAVGTLAFWQLSATFLTCGFSMSLLSAHGVPMLTDHGYTPIFAAWAFGVLGGASILFTMLIGPASDRFGRRPVLAAIYAGRAVTFAGFFLIRDNPVAIMAVAIFGGVTLAGTLSMTSALTADIYGRYSIGTILGTIFLVHQTGAAVGSWLAGALFEATGGYGASFTMSCAVLVGAALLSLRIDDGSRRVRWAPRPARA